MTENDSIKKLAGRVGSIEKELRSIDSKVDDMNTAIFGDSGLNPGIVGAIREMRQEIKESNLDIRKDLDSFGRIATQLENAIALTKNEKQAVEKVNEAYWQKAKLWGSLIALVFGILQLLSIVMSAANNFFPAP